MWERAAELEEEEWAAGSSGGGTERSVPNVAGSGAGELTDTLFCANLTDSSGELTVTAELLAGRF